MRLPINMICVSAWLLLNVKSVFFQLHFLNHGKNKLIFNEMMTKSNMLSWIFIVQAHWNNRLRIDMSPHSYILSGFRRDRSSNLRFIALELCMLTITPQMWFNICTADQKCIITDKQTLSEHGFTHYCF
jgi:hypothetical protein